MELEKFIKTYSSTDFQKIKFDWNGKHGDELEDPNMGFRIHVCDFLIHDFSIGSDQLILDLYQELSKSAKETWGVYRGYHLFAQEILNRGKTKYVLDYLKGAMQSFDTSLASGRIQLTDDEKQEILNHINSKISNDSNRENLRYYELALKRFNVK